MNKEAELIHCHTLTQSEGGYEIGAVVYELGNDCLIILHGGSKPHIGAIGMGQVRVSLKDPGKVAATSSVFTYVGHKEDVIAKGLSEEITRRLGRNTVIVAGVHWDDLPEEGIRTVTNICRSLSDRIVEKLARPGRESS